MAFFALLSACGIPYQTTTLNAAPHPMKPKPADAVHLFTTSRPTQPYDEVLLFQTEEDKGNADHYESEIVASFRQRAGELGCDALIVEPTKRNVESCSGKLGPWTRTVRGFRATCVVYREPLAAPVASAEPSGHRHDPDGVPPASTDAPRKAHGSPPIP